MNNNFASGNMSHNRYTNLGPGGLVQILEHEYYATIGKLCTVAETQSAKLKAITIREAISQYLLQCSSLITDITVCMSFRAGKLIPYVKNTWTEEGDEPISGYREDEALFPELKASIEQLKDILSRIQLVTLPLYSDTIYPEAYRILRNHMALIENCVAEVIWLEESYLVPKLTAGHAFIR